MHKHNKSIYPLVTSSIAVHTGHFQRFSAEIDGLLVRNVGGYHWLFIYGLDFTIANKRRPAVKVSIVLEFGQYEVNLRV